MSRSSRTLARRPALAVAVLATGAVLAGCATTPATPTATAGPPGAGGADRAGVYAEATAAARRAAAAGRLREALWRWRLAEAVTPDRVATAQEADAAQARLTAAADAAEQEGARAAKDGRAAEARAAYTRTLELDPQRPDARAYMRTVLAAQVISDVDRLAGSEPKTRRKGKATHPAHRPHAHAKA